MRVTSKSMLGRLSALAILAAGAIGFAPAGFAAEELNLYSSRHYDTDERLYSDFEQATGIKINRIEDKASALIARIEAEGDKSPADILITVDAGRLWKADEKGLFQPTQSALLDERVPAHLRHPDGHWIAFSSRARIIFYDKARVNPSDLPTYESLADPKWKGMVCTRSSGNIYMLSLMASLIHYNGEAAALDWAKGVYVNRARDPEGGDTDQLRSIASGQCGIALANSYYFARALRKDVRDLKNPEDTGRIGVIFPNQDGRGAHVNVSGAGMLKHAPNAANAVKFLEYLASDQAQRYFSQGNDEYPVVAGIEPADNVTSLGDFKADELPLIELGRNQARAQQLYDKAGYK